MIELFTAQLGSWSFYLIGTIAFVTMFTTLLTVLDGQVRVLQFAAALFKPEVLQAKRIYPVGIVLYGLGGLSVVMFLAELHHIHQFRNQPGVSAGPRGGGTQPPRDVRWRNTQRAATAPLPVLVEPGRRTGPL